MQLGVLKALAPLGFAVALGCSGEAGDVGECRSAADSSCWSEHYFQNYPASHAPSCVAEAKFFPVGADVSVELFRSSSLEDAQYLHVTRGLQRYYAPHSMRFRTEHEALRIELSSVVSDRGEALDAALDAAGIPDGEELLPEQAAKAEEIAIELLFEELRAFMQRTALPARPLIHLVVVEEVLPQKLAARLPEFSKLTGLGFSPKLVARLGQDERRSVERLLGVSGEFTPTAFVARAALERSGLRADELVAHEVGHAFALPHSSDLGNLMRPVNDYGDCRPVLTEEQVATIVTGRRSAIVVASVARQPLFRSGVVRRVLERAISAEIGPF